MASASAFVYRASFVSGAAALAVVAVSSACGSSSHEPRSELACAGVVSNEWTVEELAPPGLELGEPISVAFDEAGGVHAAYRANGGLVYAHRDPAGLWSSETLDAQGENGAVAIDRTGNVHASWIGNRPTGQVLFYARRLPQGPAGQAVAVSQLDTRWSTPVLTFDATGAARIVYLSIGRLKMASESADASGWVDEEAQGLVVGDGALAGVALGEAGEAAVLVAQIDHSGMGDPNAGLLLAERAATGTWARADFAQDPSQRYFAGSLALDRGGDLHLAYVTDPDAPAPQRVLHAQRSPDGAMIWEDVMESNSEATSMVVGPDGALNLVIAHPNRSADALRRGPGGGWTTLSIAGSRAAYGVRATITASGVLHAVMQSDSGVDHAYRCTAGGP